MSIFGILRGNGISDTFSLSLLGCVCRLQLLLHIDELLQDVTAEMTFSLLLPLCQLTQHYARKIQCQRSHGDVKVPCST